MPTRKFSSAKTNRSFKRVDRVVDPIKEDDFLKLRGILRRNPHLAEYVEAYCLFRMVPPDRAAQNGSLNRVNEIVDSLNQNKNVYGLAKLPKEAEEAKEIILKITERHHFERVIRETQAIA